MSFPCILSFEHSFVLWSSFLPFRQTTWIFRIRVPTLFKSVKVGDIWSLRSSLTYLRHSWDYSWAGRWCPQWCPLKCEGLKTAWISLGIVEIGGTNNFIFSIRAVGDWSHGLALYWTSISWCFQWIKVEQDLLVFVPLKRTYLISFSSSRCSSLGFWGCLPAAALPNHLRSGHMCGVEKYFLFLL